MAYILKQDTIRRDGLTKTYNSGFGLALLVKDLGITKEFMAHSKFDTDLPELIQRYLSDALKEVDPQADHTALLKAWEKRSGVDLQKADEFSKITQDDFDHRLRGLNRP